MKKPLFVCCLLASASLLSCKDDKKPSEPMVASATKEEPAPAPASSPAPDSAAMQKAWNDYMTPGEAHKMMASWDGKFNADITMWMAPGAPPSKTTSTVENKMIYGGRYQQSTHHGTMQGMPFEGMSLLAYDNAKRTYISTWIDNMGTGIMTMEGAWDAQSNMMILKGRMKDPATGRDVDMRETFKPIDKNFQIMEMFCTGPDGKEYKNMEVKFTRK